MKFEISVIPNLAMLLGFSICIQVMVLAPAYGGGIADPSCSKVKEQLSKVTCDKLAQDLKIARRPPGLVEKYGQQKADCKNRDRFNGHSQCDRFLELSSLYGCKSQEVFENRSEGDGKYIYEQPPKGSNSFVKQQWEERKARALFLRDARGEREEGCKYSDDSL